MQNKPNLPNTQMNITSVNTMNYEQRTTNYFMQNKANLPDTQILVNYVLTMDYVNIRLRRHRQNKAKQSQFKPNFRKAKMNVSSVKTKDYEKNGIFAVPQNKPNSNPISNQMHSL